MSSATDENCSLPTEMEPEMSGFGNCSTNELNPLHLSIIPVFFASLLGNICTLLILAAFKRHKVADVAVGGLAVTDLIATLGPVAMSIYSYLTQYDLGEGSPECVAFATVSMFARSSSCMIATASTIDRFVAIAAPFFYKRHATPRAYLGVVSACWLLSAGIAVVPVVEPNLRISSHGGFCLFDFTSHYAFAIALIALSQFVLVLICFFLSSLILLVRSRSRLKRSALTASKRYEMQKLSLHSQRKSSAERIENFRRNTLSSLFQVRVEAEFLAMFAAVVALFYFTWLPIVVMILYAQTRQTQDMLDAEISLAIKFTILSTAINPVVYGLLARRYRQAYCYVVRGILGSCCSCVALPERNPFTGKIRATPRSPVLDRSSESPERKSEQKYPPSESDPASPTTITISDTSLDPPSPTGHEVVDARIDQRLPSFTCSSS